ncbi:MAG: hypothetical protein WC734_06045 [Patescibacteria group bacterium]|jgi:hypothetical protein
MKTLQEAVEVFEGSIHAKLVAYGDKDELYVMDRAALDIIKENLYIPKSCPDCRWFDQREYETKDCLTCHGCIHFSNVDKWELRV